LSFSERFKAPSHAQPVETKAGSWVSYMNRGDRCAYSVMAAGKALAVIVGASSILFPPGFLLGAPVLYGLAAFGQGLVRERVEREKREGHAEPEIGKAALKKAARYLIQPC
jgi:hypothetical protein